MSYNQPAVERLSLAWLAAVVLLTSSVSAQSPSLPFDTAHHVALGHHQAHPTRILAKYKAALPKAAQSLQGFAVRKRFSKGLVLIDGGPSGLAAVADDPKAQADRLLARMRAVRESGLFEFVEPDYEVHADLAPPDSAFTQGDLWGLHNTGQQGGQPGADIGAEAAWDLTTGSHTVIVAVIDTGVRYTHRDLVTQMWRNPDEIPNNGIDDDADGYVDNVYGINAITGSGNPIDDNGHGTHLAGTIGAAPNNNNPHVGVAWEVQLMACKFMNADANGYISDAIECINFAVAHGAKVLNNSWGGASRSQALFEAIEAARSQGVLFVAAAGNAHLDTDRFPNYPSCYELDNVISVAALDRNDRLASFSNYGLESVDLGAPGVDIYSSGNRSDTDYFLSSGTSMAAPHVSGVAALLLARYPSSSLAELRQRLLMTVDPVAGLAGRCVSAGRVRADQALAVNPDGVLEIAFSISPRGPLTAGQTVQVAVALSDVTPVFNATVHGRIVGGDELVFLDNGTDIQLQDGIYSVAMTIPQSGNSFEVEVEIAAPGFPLQTLTRRLVIRTAPLNDAFAARTILATGLSVGSNFSASKEPGEPNHARNAGGHSVWWSWTAPCDSWVTMDTAGSNFDTLLAVYTGTTVSGLILIEANDDVGFEATSSVTFRARQGIEYCLAVDGYDGAEGEINLQLASSPALRLLAPQRWPDGSFSALIGTVDGTPVQLDRLPNLEIYVSADLTAPHSKWTRLVGPLLPVGGMLQIDDPLSVGQPTRFYHLMERR